MSRNKTNLGEPWQLTTDFAFDITIQGELAASFDKIEHANRAIACVNACAGMSDPAAEIQALRDAASCLSRLADHGHAEDCLFLNRANAPCDCGVDQAQAALAKLKPFIKEP